MDDLPVVAPLAFCFLQGCSSSSDESDMVPSWSEIRELESKSVEKAKAFHFRKKIAVLNILVPTQT
jgi:hypothetical protein